MDRFETWTSQEWQYQGPTVLGMAVVRRFSVGAVGTTRIGLVSHAESLGTPPIWNADEDRLLGAALQSPARAGGGDGDPRRWCGEWFDADVHVRRTSDGEERIFRTEEPIREDGEWSPYIWQDGDYSCDCNREVFFAEAGGETDVVHLCSEGRYLVRVIRRSDGMVLYDEWAKAVS